MKLWFLKPKVKLPLNLFLDFCCFDCFIIGIWSFCLGLSTKIILVLFFRQTSFSLLSFNLLWNSWFATSLLVDRFWCSQQHFLWLLRSSRTNICLNLTWLTLWMSLHWRELHSSTRLLKKDRKFTVLTPSFPRFCWWTPLLFHDVYLTWHFSSLLNHIAYMQFISWLFWHSFKSTSQ